MEKIEVQEVEIPEKRQWFLLSDKNSFAASHSKTFL